MSNVLVIFQADTEHTEQMALAVGVGAVEAEASIRLRRLAAPGAAEVAHKGYGKLQAADILWANTVVVGLESPAPRAEDLGILLALLSEIDPHDMTMKQAWTFNPEGLSANRSESQIVIESALRIAGLNVLSMEVLVSTDDGHHIARMKEAGRVSAH
jgi:hypothetical protein